MVFLIEILGALALAQTNTTESVLERIGWVAILYCMRINEKLGTLLTLLMEQSWHPESVTVSRKRMELAAVKEYLDEHYTEKLTLDDLAEKFFINKFYLSKIFKETYGTTVNNYLISKRITRAKQLLRFTDMTVDEVGAAVGMGDANYFSRMFRKVEGISPREYRKQW